MFCIKRKQQPETQYGFFSSAKFSNGVKSFRHSLPSLSPLCVRLSQNPITTLLCPPLPWLTWSGVMAPVASVALVALVAHSCCCHSEHDAMGEDREKWLLHF